VNESLQASESTGGSQDPSGSAALPGSTPPTPVPAPAQPDDLSEIHARPIHAAPLPKESGSAREAPPARKPSRRPPNEPPVLVIESSIESATRPSPKSETASKQLEAMVQDLLRKVRVAEDQIRERDSAISRLQEQTAAMARKLESAGDGGDGGRQSDPLALDALDFFSPGRPTAAGGGASQALPKGSLEKLPRAVRASRAARARGQTVPGGQPRGATPAAAPGGGWSCPTCEKKLRKAKCANVRTLICLGCQGVFVDGPAVRQLARTQSWFRSVERFLSAAQKAATGGKAAKTSQPQKSVSR
jgi:Zn-finger nucleic acid-binding protein